ncbi:MAG: hypothetical protein ACRELD_01300 [Longimicrobiales bacterium]
MATHVIHKNDGTPSKYFWSDKHGSDKTKRTIYKRTANGVTRMKGVHFDTDKQKLRRD